MKRVQFLLLAFLLCSSAMAQDFWQRTDGPYGGNIRALAIDASGHIFAGTWGGVFLSTNNGTSWTRVNTGLTSTNVQSLAISGTNIFAGTFGGGVFLSTNNGTSWTGVNIVLTSTVVRSLAVSGTNIFAGTWGGGVFLSTNNGTSWTAVNTGLTKSDVCALAVSGTNLFAGTNGGGVFLSTNNGTSWTAVNTGLTNTNVLSLAVSGTNIFAGTSGGVFLSTNNGTSWTGVNTGLTNTVVQSLAISGTNIFAGTSGGVFLSTNNGTSWTGVNTGLTSTVVQSLAVSGTNIFAGTSGGGVFLSTNNGTSWIGVNTGLTSSYVTSLAISGTNIFAGTSGGGVFLSTNNGTSWTGVNTGLTNTNVLSLAVSGTSIFAGTWGGGVFLSTNNGTSWTAVNTGLTNSYVRALAVSGTNLFAGTDGGGVFLSTNNGASWTGVNTGLSWTVVWSLAVSGTNIFAGTLGGGVFLSTNNGASWTGVNTGLTSADVWSLAVSGTNIFAGTSGGVFLSTNNGTSWTGVNTGLTSADVWSLAVSGTNIFAGTLGGVFLSTNNGGSWTAVNSGLTDARVCALALSGTNIFAGTLYGGVFLSTNNGASWTGVNTGLTNSYVLSLAVSSDKYLFAGTDGSGVFRSVRPIVGIKEVEPNNTAGQANQITLGDIIDGAFSVTGDVDYFKVNLSAGDTIDVTGTNTAGSTIDGYLRLYDASGNSLEENDDFLSPDASRITYIILTSGTYYIRYASHPTGGDYPNALGKRSPIVEPDLILAKNRSLSKKATSALADTGSYRLTVNRFRPSASQLVTYGAFNIWSNSAVFDGILYPNGLNTSLTVQFGATTSYGQGRTLGSIHDIQGIYFLDSLFALAPNATYNYRIVATNARGTVVSENCSFTTPPSPNGWARVKSGVTTYLWNVVFADANVGMIVGGDGAILKTADGGKSWAQQTSNTWELLRGISMVSPTVAIAVGNNGTILRTNNGGVTWASQVSGSTTLLYDVHFADANTGVAVGRVGTILRTTDGGATWKPQNSGTGQSLCGLDFADANLGLAVGLGGTILRTTDGGKTWALVASPTAEILYRVDLVNARVGYIVGDGGVILKTTDGGVSWIQQTSGTSAFFLNVVFSDEINGSAVASDGEIWRTQYGGASWFKDESGTWNWLRGAAFAGSGTLVVVGDVGTILRKTLVAAPSTPALASPANGVTNQPVPVTLSWNAVAGAATYHLQVSPNNTFATLVENDSTLTTTSKSVSLSYGTTYFWRVRAMNAGGASTFSTPWSFSTAGAPTITVTSTPSVWATGFIYPVTWTSSNLTGTVAIGLSTNGGSSYTTIGQFANTGSASVSVPPSTPASTNCKLRISLTLNSAVYGESGTFTIVSGSLPSTIQLSGNISFGSDLTASTSYRLVSLPGNVSSLSLSQILTGSQKTDWRMYSDNGASSNFLVELSGGSTLSVGEGYWLLKRGGLTISRSVSAVTVGLDATYAIQLHSGWNIIGNPFDKNIAWSAVLNANGITPTATTRIQDYNGSYSTSGSLDAYKGYYYFNSSGASSLKIPYPFGGKIGTIDQLPPVDWKIQLNFASDINEDPENFVGIAPAAKEGFDDLESHKPPLFMDQGFLYFERRDWDKTFSLFSSDFRPSLGDGQVWDFVVQNPRKSVGRIRFTGIESVSSEFDVKLVNLSRASPVDLRINGEYSYRGTDEITKFKLVVGKKQFVEQELVSLIPQTVELLQNYPNPFNSSTTIIFRIPKERRVQLDILSVLGQRVRTLVDEWLTPGSYSIAWDGTDMTGRSVASGVYFYRLVSEGHPIQTRKLTILK